MQKESSFLTNIKKVLTGNTFIRNIIFFIRGQKNTKSEVDLFKQNLNTISLFLKNGNYVFKNSKIKRVLTKKKDTFCVNNNTDHSQYDRAVVHFGGWTKKVVVIFKDSVLSCYPEKNIYWIKNIEKYLPECNYPKTNYLVIDEKQGYTSCERVKGPEIKGYKHVLSVLEQLLAYGSKAKKIFKYDYDSERQRLYYDFPILRSKYNITDLMSYVQHGDAVNYNVLLHKGKYTFIDFDYIDVYPAFYDFFQLLTFSNNINVFLPLFLGDHFDAQIIKVIGESENSITEIKDKYLSTYYMINKYRMLKSVNVLRSLLPDSYTLTWQLINNKEY